ncbi:DNA alkylation repair protein [Tuanshanicoccus lijuaniae]|uniref:DNA alkylation repair protein n=1 Tax=Aerococcaceae bacterium zg-1292 TaxID=2774330 RepID=UPI001938A969|nr:DNA alkylation repair protein [Aerococcaceae bacterium zg-1292]QQA37857.1 DNA alkylation repair protein [Aerococcaceae bacterium zg-1292]
MDIAQQKYQSIEQELQSVANKQKAIAMANYMRNQFEFLGVQTPTRKQIMRDFYKIERKQGIDWTFIDACYQSPYREMHYVALDYLKALEKFLRYEDIPHLRLLAEQNTWWDTIDQLDLLIGNIGLNDERVNDLMLEWSQDSNFWIRRIAIDHQLTRKEQTNTELLEQIIINNFGSKEFFINKAIGWSLRDYSKTNPNWVRQFIEQYHEQLSTLSIREASKYL